MDSHIQSHRLSAQLPRLPHEIVSKIICADSTAKEADQLCSDTRRVILRREPRAIAGSLSRFLINAPLQQATQAQTDAALARFVKASRLSNSIIIAASLPRSGEHFDDKMRQTFVSQSMARLRSTFDKLCDQYAFNPAAMSTRALGCDEEDAAPFPSEEDDLEACKEGKVLHPLRRDELHRAFALTQSAMRSSLAVLSRDDSGENHLATYREVLWNMKAKLEREAICAGIDKIVSALSSSPFCAKHLEVDIRLTPSSSQNSGAYNRRWTARGLENLIVEKLASFDLSAVESLRWRTGVSGADTLATHQIYLPSAAVNVKDLSIENHYFRWADAVRSMNNLTTLHLHLTESDSCNIYSSGDFFANTSSNLRTLSLELPKNFFYSPNLSRFKNLRELRLKIAHSNTFSSIRHLPEHIEHFTLILPGYGDPPFGEWRSTSLRTFPLRSPKTMTFVFDERRIDELSKSPMPLSCSEMSYLSEDTGHWQRMLFALSQSFDNLQNLEEVVVNVPPGYHLATLRYEAVTFGGATFPSIPEQLRARSRYFAQHRQMPQPSFRWTFRETIKQGNTQAHTFSAMDGAR